ncbi:short-chain dehydrogenase/reductase [Fusarium sp. MPI-SDFR-AT-0072]|nr:short-chain dehydrogenase/reductase [Fusarium sp. MPI-SDFR-AT-0072]
MLLLGNVTGTNSVAFDLNKNTPSLQGKTILITGGDSGIGKQAICYLALLSPSEIWLAVKDVDNANVAVADIKRQAPNARLRTVHLDLASFSSIKAAAATLIAQIERLDLLFLNAGVMGVSAGLTEDGYEYQFGINHLGHALLAKLLLPVLIRTAEPGRDVRVIVTSSYSHRNAPSGRVDFNTLKTDAKDLPTLKRYAQSKLANILFARALAEKYPQLTALAIHPGACRTNLVLGVTEPSLLDRIVGFFVYQPVEIVAKHHVWAAVTQDLESGEYYEPLGISGQGRPEARDKDLALKLWNWTEHELKLHAL